MDKPSSEKIAAAVARQRKARAVKAIHEIAAKMGEK